MAETGEEDDVATLDLNSSRWDGRPACTRECLAAVADDSLSGRRVARELDLLLAVHRKHQEDCSPEGASRTRIVRTASDVFDELTHLTPALLTAWSGLQGMTTD